MVVLMCFSQIFYARLISDRGNLLELIHVLDSISKVNLIRVLKKYFFPNSEPMRSDIHHQIRLDEY